MKTFTVTISVRHLVYGVLLMLTPLVFYSFVSMENEAEVANQEISVEEAKVYFQNNRNSNMPWGDGMDAIVINTDIINAMNTVKTRTGSSSYRVYFGKNNEGENRAMVVGINMAGMDDVSYIESVSQVDNVGGCPTICDANSPIVK